MPEIHAPGPQEHSLCGLAPEAFESGDAEEPVVFAEPGQAIKCSICKDFIDYVRANFSRNYRYIGD